MINKGNTLSAVIKNAKNNPDKPKYVQEKGRFIIYYLKEKNGWAHWQMQDFLDEEEAVEFYLKKYYEFMYSITLPFYKEFKPKEK